MLPGAYKFFLPAMLLCGLGINRIDQEDDFLLILFDDLCCSEGGFSQINLNCRSDLAECFDETDMRNVQRFRDCLLDSGFPGCSSL